MEMRSVFAKVFKWMFIGLLITFGTAYYVSLNENMVYNIFGTNLYWVLVIAELVLVMWLSAAIHKLSYGMASTLFCLYSFVSGLTFAVIFLAFEMGSIVFIFGLASLIFGIFAFIGHTTKIDLSKFGSLLLMGLIGLILATIVNMFLKSDMLGYALSWICILLFVGITAYDIQKIKIMATTMDENKVGVYGALQLYLDFINIFISLLKLFGKRK